MEQTTNNPYDEIVSKELTVFNGSTTDITPLEDRIDSIAYAINTGELPVHLARLHQMKNIDEDEKEKILSYYLGVEARNLNAYINKIVNIQGCIIYEHPPFKAKDGSLKEGYYRVLMLTDSKDEDGNFIVLSTSSRVIGEHMLYAMQLRGWYLWKQAIPYKFTKDTGGAFRMLNVSKQKEGKK